LRIAIVQELHTRLASNLTGRNDAEKRNLFLDALLRTDMVLDENILSKDERDNARRGKRHFRDFSYQPS